MISFFRNFGILGKSVKQNPTRDDKCKIVRKENSAKIPTRGSDKAAGYDLYSSENTVINAKDRKVVSTGLMIKCPEGTYGRIAPRSGLAFKHGIDVGGGVVDADYTGVVKVILFNHSTENFEIKIGDRIAQIIFEVVIHPDFEVVSSLDTTVRGDGGFGSTGKS
ncbi:deoxyuridine 5'-triphosphate nucleotidohydrolase [Coemansia reversa NRRL 1564]|uniref:Deoxyuridine 5'-triphosphate nucleotidohydrolase n=1 Tax=Coemansia reversa (strain ATCC 12441 / NRRL 1564) TaxID=763665 RepID=A0A2G5B1L0_COERN|nr:deoxyuridine 5'-triphosphate nucleotidohydrolase [Coemansia reversa NRRL 1564]|eukprot:PIA12607.1 deoxyuridine 5'-triphosphate nucleotidohydrolase [Coemansia reversa NRRL 1564]